MNAKDGMKTAHWRISGCASVLLFIAGTSIAAPEGVKHQAGDCVEYDTTNALNPALRWRKGRITANDGFFFSIELEARDRGGPESTTVSVASAPKWLRHASGCAKAQTASAPSAPVAAAPKDSPKTPPPASAPAQGAGACPMNKDYAKVQPGAAASAELFKSVIFEWEQSLNKRFRDFGLTFPSFQMGKPFQNRVYSGVNARKDVDAAPVDAKIYPIKAKLLTCQKDISITIRRLWDIEYNCYQDRFGQWVCSNNAPRQLEQATLPNS